MSKWITVPALLVAGGASAIASALVFVETHENHDAPEMVRDSGRLTFAISATGPFGLLFAVGRSVYYATR